MLRILWKIFRTQAFTGDGILRSVHLMELRTLRKMGFQLIVVDLAKWHALEEPEKLIHLKEQIALSLAEMDH